MREQPPQPQTPPSKRRLERILGATAALAGTGALLLTLNNDPKDKSGTKKEPQPKPPNAETTFESGTPIGANTLKGTRAEHRGEFEAAKHVGTAYKNVQELRKKLAAGELVSVTDTNHYFISGVGDLEPNPEIKKLYKALRPNTKKFLDFFAAKFYKEFGAKLKITSLTRTIAYVDELRKKNQNASKTSSHLFGTTFDFSHAVMTAEQKAWVAEQLLALEQHGVVEATLENVQPCFHVFVIAR